MSTVPIYKAVLSRTVISNGEIKRLHVVKPSIQADGSTRFETLPFNFETEATIMVDYPVALLTHTDLKVLSSVKNMSQLIETALFHSAMAATSDTAVMLKPGELEVLDFQTCPSSRTP